MSDYNACPICGRWSWLNTHKCPPLWLVAPEDDPQDVRSIHGVDAEEAAEKWAENHDSGGEYYLARGHEMVVVVGTPGGTLMRVSVEGETVPSYSARELGPALIPAESGLGDRPGNTAEGKDTRDESIPEDEAPETNSPSGAKE